MVEEFQPEVLHGHYLGMGLLLKALAEKYQLPFTKRTHSMDVLNEPEEKLRVLCEAANSRWCKQVIAFPGNVKRLATAGLQRDKITECWPVINFDQFYKPEPRPRTGRILCVGPVFPKKAHGDFIKLAVLMRDRELQFDLYGLGAYLPEIRKLNQQHGGAVNLTYADPEEMADVYQRYDWIVYPSDTKIGKVGLLAAIAEAQACGLGVAWQELPGRREEQLEFLGGAGFLFKNIHEVPEILARPYPEEMRLAGFKASRRCDVDSHKHLLSEVWARAVASSSPSKGRPAPWIVSE